MGSDPLHEEVWLLIPWWVNGRLSGADATRVRNHLHSCVTCRREVAQQTRLRETVRADDRVVYSPQASFEKLAARIDELEREMPVEAPAARSRRRAGLLGRAEGSRWLVAALLVQGVGIALLAMAFLQLRAPYSREAGYTTVTTPAPARGSGRKLRAVFADGMTAQALAQLLHETRLVVVDGPSERGVYTLAASTPGGTVDAALASLRSHPDVRFAEPVQ